MKYKRTIFINFIFNNFIFNNFKIILKLLFFNFFIKIFFNIILL
jgi:hypothetical protein